MIEDLSMDEKKEFVLNKLSFVFSFTEKMEKYYFKLSIFSAISFFWLLYISTINEFHLLIKMLILGVPCIITLMSLFLLNQSTTAFSIFEQLKSMGTDISNIYTLIMSNLDSEEKSKTKLFGLLSTLYKSIDLRENAEEISSSIRCIVFLLSPIAGILTATLTVLSVMIFFITVITQLIF